MSTSLIYIVFFGLIFGFALIKAIPVYKQMKRLISDSLEIEPKTTLNLSQQWAIAAGANLAALNGNILNTIKTGTSASIAKMLLKRDWDIITKEDAIETIEWLFESGHSLYFGIIQEIIETYPVSEHLNAIEVMQKRLEEAGHDRNLVEYYQNLQLGVKKLREDGVIKATYSNSILAWDLGRVINLCRWSFDLGLFTEREVWHYCAPAAQKLQEVYTSWEDLSIGYLQGRIMWGGIKRDCDLVIHWHKALLQDKQSPWLNLAWHQPLN